MNKKFQIFFGLFLVLISANFISGMDYPSPFVVNNSIDVAIIYGTNSGVSSLEVISAGNLQGNLENKFSIELGDILVKDSKIDSVSNHNLILIGSVGNGCSNSAFEKVLDKSCEEIIEESGISTGHFLVESIENPYAPEKIVLVIMGYQVADVSDAVSYLMANSFDTSVGSKYISFSDSEQEDSQDGYSQKTKTYTKLGTYNVRVGDTISFPDTWAGWTDTYSATILNIDLDPRNDSWYQYTGQPRVYIGGRGVGLVLHDGESANLLLNPVSNIYVMSFTINSIDVEKGVASITVTDPNANNNSDEEKSLSEIVGKVQLIYDDNYITPLDLIILGNLQTWLNEKGVSSEIKKNSEISNDDLDDKVVVFVYNREAVVIYGKDISSSLKLVWAGNIQTHLYEEQGNQLLFVCQDMVKSDKTNSNDLKDYFCKTILNPVNEGNPIEFPNENSYLCNGCKLDNKCYPFGYRKDKRYCSDDFEFIEQKKAEHSCENNFECSSNVCISGKCIDEGFIQKILNWFKKLFGSR